jgi:DNA-3-methyladenine glycosylase I
MTDSLTRCNWANTDPLYKLYHDSEWGVPLFDDTLLFEFLILEGMQAGLSWLTILKKREGYRAAFDGFDARKIALYDDKKIEELMANSDIIRNKLKIDSVISNAKAYLQIKKEYGSFAKYIWKFVKGQPIKNNWRNINLVPTQSVISDKMSKDLKKRGFNFVGTTICYAFMQAVGMVNDHTVECFRHKNV